MGNNTYYKATHETFGPQGEHVVALLERARHLTPGEASALGAARDAALDVTWGAAVDATLDAVDASARDAALDAAWDATWDVTWGAARDAALDAARGAALDAALDAVWNTALDASWDAALDAALGLVARDLISTERYNTLTRPWRTVIGPIHPDDPELPNEE